MILMHFTCYSFGRLLGKFQTLSTSNAHIFCSLSFFENILKDAVAVRVTSEKLLFLSLYHVF